MLLIYKGNVALRVSLEEGSIRIRPVVGRFDNPQLLQALARNEELMAQIHLTHLNTEDTPDGMALYFEQKGWLVRRPGQTMPGDNSAWAES